MSCGVHRYIRKKFSVTSLLSLPPCFSTHLLMKISKFFSTRSFKERKDGTLSGNRRNSTSMTIPMSLNGLWIVADHISFLLPPITIWSYLVLISSHFSTQIPCNTRCIYYFSWWIFYLRIYRFGVFGSF